MDDIRLNWMKDVIYRFLSLDITDQAFEELLKRDDSNLNIFLSFFSGSKESPRCIFFYYDIVEEEIEKEEPVEIPVEKEKTETSFSSGSVKSESDVASASIADTDDAENDDASKEGETDEDDTLKESGEKNENAENRNEAEKMSRTSLMLIVKKTELHFLHTITEYVSSRSYMYFLIRKDGPVPDVSSLQEAWEVLPRHFDLGRICQHPLVCIDKTIASLYMPLFADETLKPHMSTKHYPIDEKQLSSLLSDINKEMREFTDSTQQILAQIEKPFMFSLPSIPDLCNLAELAQETDFVAEAQDLVKEWGDIVSELYEEVNGKKPSENGLIYEIDFWKTQKLKLSICWDQLSHSTVQRTVTVLDLAGCDIRELISNVKHLEMELNKVTENVNYLSLLEKNAKSLLPGTPSDDALRSLLDIFTVLKVMWVQSEHYRETGNLGRLLRGVAILLRDRVVTEARNDLLFRKPLQEVSKIVDKSIEILEYWKELYYVECETVKKYGGPYWWRFDVRMLFDETDYIISVCGDLGKVSKALQELHNIFNTNLRFFVEDQKRLSTMENRIFGMTALIQYAEFDVFDRKFKPDWDRIMFVFLRDVSNFEEEIKSYIGGLFRTSLTWENAYILARSFDEQEISASIKEFIGRSRTDMLKQFIREISETENEFLAHEHNPPLLDGIPAATSSILWAKYLLMKISRPMAKIFENGTMSKKDIEVQERFKKTEQILLSYQNSKYDDWKVEAAEKLNQFLRTNLLSKQSLPSAKLTGITRLEATVSYMVNFPIYLEEIAAEARILEPLGYEITSFVANVVLQEKTFVKQRNELTIILKELKNCLSALQQEEISVLEMPIESLCSALDLGANEIQWETTRIPEFLKKSKQAVDVFKGLVAQIKNIFLEIDKQIELLSTWELVEWPEGIQFNQTCEDFFGDAEIRMEKKITRMVNIQRSLGPLLLKLEVVTCKTATGEAGQMREYYWACEEKVLRALIQMLLSNLEYFQEEVLEHVVFPFAEAAFKSTDELVTSSTDRIKLVFVSFLKTAIESTRRLVRWLDGTCKEASPFYSEEKKLQAEFSYFLDLSLHPQIKNMALNIISRFFKHVDEIK